MIFIAGFVFLALFLDEHHHPFTTFGAFLVFFSFF